MRKRILSLLLVVFTVVTILPGFSSAAEPVRMSTSEAGLELIRQFEGFVSHAMADGGQWSIGYGSACNPADYPNGISEPEADVLLKESLEYFEDVINQWLADRGVTLEQHEFDALVSITYNLGPAWIQSSYRFWSMLGNGIDGYSENQIASALGVWCHVGSSVSTGLLQRRITEIRLFLYSDYQGTASPDFQYLIFDGNGGSVDIDVMLYRENAPYLEFPGAERDGFYFAGWFTAREGGSQVTADDIVTDSRTVYARWSATLPAAPSSGGAFSDVAEGDWFYRYVTDLSDEGLISGYRDGTFRPHSDVTAGQALKLVLLAAGFPEQAPVSSHWASGYAALALQQGLASGEELADLDQPVSRGLTAKLASNALGLDGSGAETVFADTDDACATALYHAGILEGVPDSTGGGRMFYPDQTISRAELSKIVWMMRTL